MFEPIEKISKLKITDRTCARGSAAPSDRRRPLKPQAFINKGSHGYAENILVEFQEYQISKLESDFE